MHCVCLLFAIFSSPFAFCLNTRAVISLRSDDDYPANKSSLISSHIVLYVKVMNKFGRPYVRTYVIASCAYLCMCRGIPVNVAGRITTFPNTLWFILPPFATSSRKCIYYSERNLVWFNRVKRSRSVLIFAYISINILME